MDSIMAEKAKAKFGSLIEAGRARVGKAIAGIAAEAAARRDLIVPAERMTAVVDERANLTLDVTLEQGRESLELAPWAQGQLLDRVGLPRTYARRLIDLAQAEEGAPWAAALLADNLNSLVANNLSGRTMVRTVNGRARAILSDSYRRLDAAPIVEAYAGAAMKRGMVPYTGTLTDTRTRLTFIEDRMREPIPGEIILFGMSLTNSDYGFGPVEAAVFMLRLWCANGAVAMNLLRKVHLGKRFGGEDGAMVISDATAEADAKAIAGAVGDLFLPANFDEAVENYTAKIALANEKGVDPKAVYAKLARDGRVEAADAKRATALFAEPLPVEVLPQGDNLWRASNVLSFLAQDAEGDRKLALEDAAAFVLA